jgi:excisionase family DNA binding protein
MPMQPTLPPLDTAQRYTVNEACQYLRVSRSYLYQLIRNGQLRTIDEGRRTFVPGTAIADRSRVAA